MKHTAIVWFRNDLRLHDNEALTEALLKAEMVVPVFVFDERVFKGKTSFGFSKTSVYRTKFIIDSVLDLRAHLRKLGSDLIIRTGKPEEEISRLAAEVQSQWVYCNRERTTEEVSVQDKLEKNLWKIGQELCYVRGKMLYHTADLPFPVSQVPDIFTTFRKEIENIIPLRKPLEAPEVIPFPVYRHDRGEVPTLADLGKETVPYQHIENEKFIGGESHALKQLHYYLYETNHISQYKETRNKMLGWTFSSKFSAWLAIGCLSPKKVMQELLQYEKTVNKNESTYWLYFELLWRDYFRLIGKKYGNRIFQKNGIRNIQNGGRDDMVAFHAWRDGKTGVPLIDANMRQLAQTGFMSNRGRQNVASFLIKDLKVNWLIGAEYFESMLIDYDPCSNYGNWNYIAGIGNDPREDRCFNIPLQSKKYDPNGDFIRYWIPELDAVPGTHIHQPDLMSIEMQAKYGFITGKDYPSAIINTAKWI